MDYHKKVNELTTEQLIKAIEETIPFMAEHCQSGFRGLLAAAPFEEQLLRDRFAGYLSSQNKIAY